MFVASTFWRRLDGPGHETSILDRTEDGWRVYGAAVFRHEGEPAQLSYSVECDARWATVRGEVRGSLGARPIGLRVERGGGGWTLNGVAVPGLESLVDLDLGFTPSTNLLQLHRAGLAVGEAADIPVAWLNVEAGTLTALAQRYERRSAAEYWYEAPRFGYRAMLEVDPSGFIRRYPGLWQAV
jgi:hypothetical protein